MKTLKNETDPQRLKMNIIEYFNGFSQDVQDIIDKFKLRQQVDNLTEAGRLGSLLEKFTDENINLSVKPVSTSHPVTMCVCSDSWLSSLSKIN